MIIHCLDGKTNSNKILPEHIHDIDFVMGIFEVEKTSGGKHMVDFGSKSHDQLPWCTCKDWLRHHLPCKHFFSILANCQGWGWENFPIATCKVLTFQPTLKHDFFQPHDEDSLASAATETYITFIHKLESNCKDQ